MATANVTSNRGGAILNQTFSEWLAGVPRHYAATTTNGVLTQLRREWDHLHHAGVPQAEVTRLRAVTGAPPAQFNPIARDKFAVRIRATSTWTARSVSLRVGGTATDLTGAPDFGLPFLSMHDKHLFHVWLRGTPGKVVEVRLAALDDANANPVYLNSSPPSLWSTTATGISFTLGPIWRKYTVQFGPPLTVDGAAMGEPADEPLVFGIYNVDTADVANGDPFFFDIGGFEYSIIAPNVHSEV